MASSVDTGRGIGNISCMRACPSWAFPESKQKNLYFTQTCQLLYVNYSHFSLPPASPNRRVLLETTWEPTRPVGCLPSACSSEPTLSARAHRIQHRLPMIKTGGRGGLFLLVITGPHFLVVSSPLSRLWGKVPQKVLQPPG